MFLKRLIPSLVGVFLATQASADAMQVVDEETKTCLDRAFNSIQMPLKRFSTEAYGEVRASSPVRSDLFAAISVTTRKTFLSGAITHNFNANINMILDDGSRYITSQSIGISINHEGDLTQITEGGFRSGWGFSHYGPYTHVLEPSPHTSTQQNLIREWVENAVQTMALQGLHCLTSDIYQPSSTSHVKPPSKELFVSLAMR